MRLFSGYALCTIQRANRVVMARMTRSRTTNPQLAFAALSDRLRCDFCRAQMLCGSFGYDKARERLTPWHRTTFHTVGAERDVDRPPRPDAEAVAHRLRRYRPLP